MTAKEAYRIWAPEGLKWSAWVRPVPFLTAKEEHRSYCDTNFDVAAANYLDETYSGAAVIVDLPGTESVQEGIALAKAGYRPVPIYNGTMEQHGARATGDNRSIGQALIMAASELEKIQIDNGAMPAFLTDRSRLNRYRIDPSIYDNSWDVYPQDLPSADFLIKNGIWKVIVIGENISRDIRKILYGFQKKNIRIFLAEKYGVPQRIILHKGVRWEKE